MDDHQFSYITNISSKFLKFSACQKMENCKMEIFESCCSQTVPTKFPMVLYYVPIVFNVPLLICSAFIIFPMRSHQVPDGSLSRSQFVPTKFLMVLYDVPNVLHFSLEFYLLDTGSIIE